LDDYHLGSALALYLDGLVLVVFKRASSIGLLPEALHGVHNRSLVCCEGLTYRGIVVDVLRHHVENLRKVDQRNECRIESLSLRRIGERLSAQTRVLMKPIVNIEDLLRIGRRRTDLREQRVRVKSDGREQLIELIGCRQSALRINALCWNDDAPQAHGAN